MLIVNELGYEVKLEVALETVTCTIVGNNGSRHVGSRARQKMTALVWLRVVPGTHQNNEIGTVLGPDFRKIL